MEYDIKHNDGFPSKLKIYSAISEDDPYKLRAVFTGPNMDVSDSMQFVLSNPILCIRIKLEFHEVSIAKSLNSVDKLAGVQQLTLYKSHGLNLLYHRGVTGIYGYSNYINTHKLINFYATANSEQDSNPFTNVLDDNPNSKWVSEQEQTDTFYPTITVDFKEKINFEGIIYSGSSHKEGSLKNKKVYDGFPTNLYIYTSLGDEEFTLHTVFTGTQKEDHVQFIMPNPVKCTRLKKELHDVSKYENGKKLASCDHIIFLQSFDYQEFDNQKIIRIHSTLIFMQFLIVL